MSLIPKMLKYSFKNEHKSGFVCRNCCKKKKIGASKLTHDHKVVPLYISPTSWNKTFSYIVADTEMKKMTSNLPHWDSSAGFWS